MEVTSMVAVKEIAWEEAMSPEFENPARKAWRAAVAEIAVNAKQALPECNGRVEKAMVIVLNGDVELLPDGKARVASQSNGSTQYFVVNGTCECKDFPKAPQGWCKHRIAAGPAQRGTARGRAAPDAPATRPAAPAREPTPAAAPPAGPPPPPPAAPPRG